MKNFGFAVSSVEVFRYHCCTHCMYLSVQFFDSSVSNSNISKSSSPWTDSWCISLPQLCSCSYFSGLNPELAQAFQVLSETDFGHPTAQPGLAGALVSLQLETPENDHMQDYF